MRSIEGDFVEVAGETVVIKRSGGRTVKVPLTRLRETDRDYVAKQSAEQEAGEAAGGSLEPLIPPITLKALPMTGEGDERKAGLELTNTGNRGIEEMQLNVFFLRADGSVCKGGGGVLHGEGFFSLRKL